MGSSRAVWCGASEAGKFRLASARRCFIPRVAELELRQLLSQLVVLNNADSGAARCAEIGAASPGDLITFAGSLRGQTIALASPLVIDTNLTIRGFPQVGPTISGNGATEAFQIRPECRSNWAG